jgi:hypothetical protein
LKEFPKRVGELGAVTDSFVKYEALETVVPPRLLKFTVNRSLGVIAALAVEDSDVPNALIATTVKVSGLPVVRPEIDIGEDADVTVFP